MPNDYTIFLQADAAQYLFGLRRAQREPLRRFLDFLAEYPTLEGETNERDGVGRIVQVKLLHQIKVVYYADHSDRIVKILRIERLAPP